MRTYSGARVFPRVRLDVSTRDTRTGSFCLFGRIGGGTLILLYPESHPSIGPYLASPLHRETQRAKCVLFLKNFFIYFFNVGFVPIRGRQNTANLLSEAHELRPCDPRTKLCASAHQKSKTASPVPDFYCARKGRDPLPKLCSITHYTYCVSGVLLRRAVDHSLNSASLDPKVCCGVPSWSSTTRLHASRP